jgi:hypothetical protein
MQAGATATEWLLANPEAAFLLGLVLRAGLAWQSELTWYEYRTLHGLRRMLFPILHKALPFYQRFVSKKRGRDDAEYIVTLSKSPRGVVSELRAAGGSLHLLSSIKKRPDKYGDPWSVAHVVWTHDDGNQTEAFLFANSDGGTDVYAHYETGVSDPVGHLTDKQTDGDPRGVVKSALGVM